MIDVAFTDYNGNELATPAGLSWAYDWLSFRAEGGADQATLRATGPLADLWGLRGLLGRYVIVSDAGGVILWHGLLEAIYIQNRAIRRGLSLRNMANRVACAYTVEGVGGYSRATTDFIESTESTNRYGRKENVITATDLQSWSALLAAATELQRTYKPLRSIEIEPGDDIYAELHCIGLWHTLAWIYYANASGREIYQGQEVINQPLGVGVTSTQIGFTANHIHDTAGNLTLPGAGFTVGVSGSASNNGDHVSANQAERPAESYTATTIFFDATDDIHDDTNQGFGFIQTDDYIVVSGASNGANNGTKRITSANATHLTVNPSTIVTATVGPSITIARGTKILIDGTLTPEFPGASVTLTVHGAKLFQTFRLSTNEGWLASEVAIPLQRVGSPTDNVKLSLTTVGANGYATFLASAEVSGTDIAETMGEIVFTFEGVDLDPNVQYGILVERTGANDTANYYMVELDANGGYGAGQLQLWTGSTWIDNARSLQFRISDALESTEQIRKIVDSAGQFLANVDIQTSTGITSSQYRNGDSRALNELLSLLTLGTSDGDRLLFDVTPGRVLRVYRQPEPSATDWELDEAGTVRDGQGRPVADGTLAGQWVRVVDDVIMAVDQLGDLSQVYIEQAELRPNGPPRLQSSGLRGMWDV